MCAVKHGLIFLNMKTNEAIELLGSVKEIADALGISVQAVYQWGDSVPRLRAYEIREVVAKRSDQAAIAVEKAA